MASSSDARATRLTERNHSAFKKSGPKKGDPPGGTSGRVGCGTGWMRRPCRTQDPRSARFQARACPGLDPGETAVAGRKRVKAKPIGRSSVTAVTHAADKVAVSVELSNPDAAAIATVVVVIDDGEEFAERAGAVTEQWFGLIGGRLCRVSGGAARMDILRLPRERRRPMCRKPAIILFHRDAGGTKIRDRRLAHRFRIAGQHDRGFDRTPMDALAQFFPLKQSLPHTQPPPPPAHPPTPRSRTHILPHP